MLFIILGFVTAVYSQICDRITPRTVVDMDNLGLAQANCPISNIIKPYSAANLPWDPSSVPARGYYKISMTFQEAKPLTSCDFWASTDGSHNPTGVKFYDRPAGTLLSSTQSFTTRMTSKNYNFLMIPELNVSSIYIEVYKSTTWQLFLDAISCNTCYMPSDSITASPSRSLSPVASPTRSTSPTPTSSQTAEDTPSPSITVTVAPTHIDGSESPTLTDSESQTPSLTPTGSETVSPSPSLTVTTALTPTSANSESVSPSPSLTITTALTPTSANSESVSPSPTSANSETATSTNSETPSLTSRNTPSLTSRNTPSLTSALTPTSANSETATSTNSETPSLTSRNTPSLTSALTPTSANSETVSPSPSLTATKSLTVTKSVRATRSLTTTKSLTESLSTTLTETLSPSLTPTHSEKQNTSNTSNISNIYIDMSLPLSNSTGVGSIITQLAESPNVMILGGVAVGVGSLSFLIIAAQYLSKKFAPGPDGKRPSISSVASGLLSSAKAQATTVLKEVSEDVEQAIKKEVSGAMKDPKSLLTYAKNPNGLLNSVKGGLATSIKSAVAKNGATSESSVVLKMIDKVLPGLPGQPQQVPSAPSAEAVEAEEAEADAPVADAPAADVPTVPTTGPVTTIQIDPEHLEAIQKMLELMNKPHLVVTTSPPNEPSL